VVINSEIVRRGELVVYSERLFAESKTRHPPEAKEVIESKIIPCERPAETLAQGSRCDAERV
jgi:hypothetical protein